MVRRRQDAARRRNTDAAVFCLLAGAAIAGVTAIGPHQTEARWSDSVPVTLDAPPVEAVTTGGWEATCEPPSRPTWYLVAADGKDDGNDARQAATTIGGKDSPLRPDTSDAIPIGPGQTLVGIIDYSPAKGCTIEVAGQNLAVAASLGTPSAPIERNVSPIDILGIARLDDSRIAVTVRLRTSGPGALDLGDASIFDRPTPLRIGLGSLPVELDQVRPQP
ncbi:MAG: hypothetical protein LBB54_05985 [Cellulomonadaceae bacterium]|jgi:hypothetical protein|nr:hypothetical protein [Cellulomonadaceae bacterium]